MLKLIVSKPRPFAGIDVSEYDSEIKKAVREDHKVSVLAGAYLHGKVESFFGYDITVCLNAEECVDFDKEEYKEGIYPVEVDGYNERCIAYLWNGIARGLIVDEHDKEAIQHALKCYEKKQSDL